MIINSTKVKLFGYGSTTQALAKHFKSVTFFDDKVVKPFKDEFGNQIRPSFEFNPKYSTLEIPSPGISPDNALIKNAKNLISEYDFFSDSMPFSIWISGTNGKTTTTQMIDKLLEDKNAVVGGNIGTALGNLDTKKDIWILETSSYTLHYTNRAKPNIYILLPISPDHLSWHGSFEAYEEAKLKPLKMMQEGETVILPMKYKNIPTKAFKILYHDSNDLAKHFDIDTKKLDYKGGFLLDAVIAMGIDKILFDRTSYDKINSFVLDAHRQEKVYDTQGRLWVNDSKATNIDATLAALQSYHDKKIYLILGGDDKGVELEPLFEAFQKISEIELFCIGSNEKRLLEMANKFTVKAFSTQTIQNAILKISSYHDNDSVAILSPAAASFDQFKSYVERGTIFRELCQKA
jgi:UDP-N-acetylmuramoylalanine--D-glutamate ligase